MTRSHSNEMLTRHATATETKLLIMYWMRFFWQLGTADTKIRVTCTENSELLNVLTL